MAPQAKVFWENFRFDGLLIFVAVAAMVLSLLSDIVRGNHYFFQLSGGIMLMAVVWLTFRSVNKHRIKTQRNFARRYWLETSKEQKFIDGFTFVMALVGTAVVTYGDKIFNS